VPNWKKLIVSGSDAHLNSLSVTENVTAASLTGSLQTDIIQFTGQTFVDGVEGQLGYSFDNGRLTFYTENDTPIEIGRSIYARVRNADTVPLTKGVVVDFTDDTTGQTPRIKRALASDTPDCSCFIGVVIKDIPVNDFGYIMLNGVLDGLNLTTFDTGDQVFLSAATPGQLTSIIPSSPVKVIRVGKVLNVGNSPTQGVLFVRPENRTLDRDFVNFESTFNTGSFTGSFEGEFFGNLVGTASFATEAENVGKLEKVFYVTEEGDDTDDGKSLSSAFRTIKKATEAAADLIDGQPTPPPFRISIRVKTGYYTEEGPITVPPSVSILGDDLRSVVVSPTEGTKTENLFLMNNGTYVWGLRLEGCEIDDLEDPRKGFFFAFAPGAFITTSPYVQNCSAIHTPADKFFAPLNPQATPPNPLIGKGPGGMIVDDSVLDGYSPLKSMIIDAYTQVAFNGVGICVRGGGYAQLVSFFTNFSRTGVYCIDGGHASLLNSNTTFGDFGLRAEGKRMLVVPTGFEVDTLVDESGSLNIASEKENILDFMITGLQGEGAFSEEYEDTGSSIYQFTIKDAGLLIDAISSDLLSPTPSRTIQFTQGLFKAQDISTGSIFTLPPTGNFDQGAITVFPLISNSTGSLAEDFVLSYDLIKDFINDDPDELFTALDGQTLDKVNQLLDIPTTVIQEVVVDESGSQYLQEFGSLITSTAHDFSYAGSGVNFLGLPSNQGGVGETDFELRVFEDNGGRVFHTSGDESGDFFVGNDFAIKQATGVIEGRTFNKAIASRFTPLNLALQ
jgi:hypothetical protein